MTEDFIGKNGRLEEFFVSADNENLKTVAFEKFEERAAKEKPYLSEGLKKLKGIMGEKDFDRLINSAENINISTDAMLILTGDEKIRTILTAKCLSAIQAAFNVNNIRIVGGGRGGIDAY